MAEYNLKQFDIDKVFIPKHAYKNAFTVLAKDNIDLNASSTTTTNHYLRTSMTMLHSPTINAPGELYTSNFKEQVQTRYDTLKINSIPESYSKLQIPHITASKDIMPCQRGQNFIYLSKYKLSIHKIIVIYII